MVALNIVLNFGTIQRKFADPLHEDDTKILTIAIQYNSGSLEDIAPSSGFTLGVTLTSDSVLSSSSL